MKRYIPILFSAPMVKALLNGTKTQTRSTVKPKYSNTSLELRTDKGGSRLFEIQNDVPPPVKKDDGFTTRHIRSYAEVLPKCKKGDILWVRESFCLTQPKDPETYHFGFKDGSHSINPASEKYNYHSPNIWKPSIHMPFEACRIFLEVIDVRAERLQSISDNDAFAEGIKVIEDYYWTKGALNYMYGEEHSYKREYFFLDGSYGFKGMPDHNGVQASFFSLWASINKWESVILNPWVWVYEFKIIDKPKDF